MTAAAVIYLLVALVSFGLVYSHEPNWEQTPDMDRPYSAWERVWFSAVLAAIWPFLAVAVIVVVLSDACD